MNVNLDIYGEPDPRICHLAACAKCDLSPKRSPHAQQVVLPYGNLDTAFLAVIGQSPGQTEDKTGRPFSGPYHSLVRDLIEICGLSFQDFVLLNALWCHPENNKKALKRQLDACRHNTSEVFQHMPIQLALLVGADALRTAEGEEARLDLRDGNLGYCNWRLPSGKSVGFHTFPIYHPARWDKFENPRGIQRGKMEYLARLYTLRDLIKLIKSGQDLSIPYDYRACWTREDCYAALDHLKRLKPYRIAIDFETWSLDYDKIPVGVAIAYAPYKAYYFPLTQAVELEGKEEDAVLRCVAEYPRFKHLRKGKHRDYVLVTHGPKGWFYDNWDHEFMGALGAWLASPDRPMISAQHAQIEMDCCATYGFELLPHPDQLEAGVCFDTMVLARGVTTGNRVNLETILQQAMPLEVYNKGLIQDYLTKEQVFTTGFAMMSINPARDNVTFEQLREWHSLKPGEFPAPYQDLVTKYIIPELGICKAELLANRAMFDADVEYRLVDMLPKVGKDLRFTPFDIDSLLNQDEED